MHDVRQSSPGRRRRIAFVIGTLDVGGTERQLLELATRLSRGPWEVRVYPFVPGGPLEEDFEQADIRVRPLRRSGPLHGTGSTFRRAFMALAQSVRLNRELREWRPDLVHAFLSEACLVAALGAPRSVPVIVSKRSLGIGQPRWQAWVGWAASLRARRILVNSAAVRHAAVTEESAPALKVRLVYNGVDAERFRPSARPAGGPIRIGMLANFIPYKGQKAVIGALARIARECDADLTLWGRRGPYLDECRALASTLGIDARVHFPGLARDAAHALQELDVLVSASTEEGLSNSILEGMATALPIVATAVGGTPEQLDDGRTGLLVPSRDLDALTTALRRVATDAGLRRRLGEAARVEVIERFSMHRMVTGIEAVYDEVLQPNASRVVHGREGH